MVDFTAGQASALSAGADLASTIASGLFSARQAKSQMRFQRDMYKQRYQFQVEDLKKAGLNPMLAYTQAPPAAPAGAMGQMEKPDLVTAARAGMLMKAEKERIEQDSATAKALELREKEQKDLLYEQKVKTIHERELLQLQREAYQAMKNNFGPMFGSYYSAQNMIQGGSAVADTITDLIPWKQKRVVENRFIKDWNRKK